MGKEVDFLSWIVITGDLNIMLNEVGVPKSIVMMLIYLERGMPFHFSRHLEQCLVVHCGK